jgi:hypothetical protein
MKKLFLLLALCVTFNAIAQKPHKATGDKPFYSEEYSFENSDSTLDGRTYYTYDNNQRIIKEITDKDSTLTTYDVKGRITSVNKFSNSVLYYSETWTYDEVNFRIEQQTHSLGDVSLEPSSQTVYYGVNDMDVTQDELRFFSLMFEDMSFRDCDSTYMKMYDAESQAWITYSKIYPVYQNGKITQAKYIINASAFGDIIGDDIPFDEMTMNLVFTYQGDKLLAIKGSTTIEVSGFPISLTDFMTINNQYNGDLLTATVTAIDVTMNGQSYAYIGMKEIYLYNNENNILCSESYSTEVKNSWTLESKTWYYYEKTGVGKDDLAILNLNSPAGTSDEIGTEVIISVNIENTSDSITYSDVHVTAIVLYASGEEYFRATKMLPTIGPSSTLTFWFDDRYLAPDDEYTLKIFIDSQDDNPFNDTLRVVRQTHTPTSIICTEGNSGFSLEQNFPNPAKNNTVINYSIPQDGEINFNIYTINGQLIYNKKENASFGEHQIELNLSDYASGIYFYTMEYKGQRVTKRMSIKR